ncbi:MAG TPA: Na+/H+ antiporter subunit E [Thiolinea sp.]|nr:Na+/H+ antiporter subunit E [Thiolinea sp.]
MNKHRSGRLRSGIILFFVLMLFWLMLSSQLRIDVFVIGTIVALVIVLLYGDGLSFLTELRLTPKAILTGFQYYGYFFKELFKSNFKLAGIVLSPSLPINPAIVKVRTRLQSRMGRLMLANSITLTPGTLSVEMDGEWLYVHWVCMETADIEQATARIVSGFESYLEVMYG